MVVLTNKTFRHGYIKEILSRTFNKKQINTVIHLNPLAQISYLSQQHDKNKSTYPAASDGRKLLHLLKECPH